MSFAVNVTEGEVFAIYNFILFFYPFPTLGLNCEDLPKILLKTNPAA